MLTVTFDVPVTLAGPPTLLNWSMRVLNLSRAILNVSVIGGAVVIPTGAEAPNMGPNECNYLAVPQDVIAVAPPQPPAAAFFRFPVTTVP